MPEALPSGAISPATLASSWYTRGALFLWILPSDMALPWHTCQRGGGSAMTFEELLDQAIALLQRRGRLTYRALKRQFNVDDDYLEDLKAELIRGQRLAVDEDGEVLVWTGDMASAALSVLAQGRAPLA